MGGNPLHDLVPRPGACDWPRLAMVSKAASPVKFCGGDGAGGAGGSEVGLQGGGGA